MKYRLFSLLLAFTSLNVFGQEPVDILLTGKMTYTVGEKNTPLANAVIINKGKVIAIGDSSILRKQYRAQEEINSKGYIYPGFIDAHCHFSGYALDGYKADLVGTTSFKEVLNRLVAYNKASKIDWIYGRGWDQNDWAVKEYPDKHELDSLFPDKPVILKRIDGHAILCNQKALDMAGININSHYDGGSVEKKNGKLTGILIDNAMTPVEAIVPPLPEQVAKEYLLQMEKTCYSYGLTNVVDCGVEADVIEILKHLYKKKQLTIGNTSMLSQTKATLDKYVTGRPFEINQLKVIGIKVYADGALGSRGACLLKEYSDKPGHRGTMLSSLGDMKRIANDAYKYNWQLCTHAIGDSANRTILKLYASVLKQKNDKRWRIEHAQVVNKEDHHYFSTYSIIPSVQPTHAISDMPWVGERIGEERMHQAYAYKTLLTRNGWIALGTDFPVEGIDPLATFYTAVARKDKQGKPENGFLIENALTREEALKGMTIWAAKSVRQENTKGSIETGKDADIVILDKDIMTIPEEEIKTTKVIYTIVNGEIKYQLK